MSGRNVPILMYHSISDEATPAFSRYAVSRSAFEIQMAWLAEHGFETLTVGQFADIRSSARVLPVRPVIVTFDDGFADFHGTALPIMRRYGIRSTLFLVSSYIGGTARWLHDCGEEQRPMLSRTEIEEVTAEGVEIAAHSHTHAQLDLLTSREVDDELRRSREVLEDMTGQPVTGLAYPFGYWKSATRRNAVATGYRYACAVDDLMASDVDDLLTLPRLTVTGDLDIVEFSALLGGRSSRLDHRRVAAKRTAWWALRQASRMLDQARGSAATLGVPRSP